MFDDAWSCLHNKLLQIFNGLFSLVIQEYSLKVECLEASLQKTRSPSPMSTNKQEGGKPAALLSIQEISWL